MRQAIWSNMVAPHMSLSVSRDGLKVMVERGCVGADLSPFAAPVGAGFSVTGRSGSPVRRSSR